MAEVSVIIPTYNRARKVARAIASVLFQTYKDYELIVVDDGSRDNTADLVSWFPPGIVRLCHKENRGVSAARNTGIRASRAPLIAFLDSDDYWLPEKLAVQVAFFDSHPEEVACQTQEIWIRKGLRVNPWKRHIKQAGNIFVSSLELCLVSPSAVMLRRSLLDEVGLFDEALPVCEDYDLWLRVSCRHPIHLLDKCLVIKEGGAPDQLSKSLTGMDRFRIKSLIKVMESGCLSPGQWEAAFSELRKKCEIYGKGCIKRGKTEEGKHYLGLPLLLLIKNAPK
jgi:glycosyltransferase involved in cell wall biosynthesis